MYGGNPDTSTPPRRVFFSERALLARRNRHASRHRGQTAEPTRQYGEMAFGSRRRNGKNYRSWRVSLAPRRSRNPHAGHAVLAGEASGTEPRRITRGGQNDDRQM